MSIKKVSIDTTVNVILIPSKDELITNIMIMN